MTSGTLKIWATAFFRDVRAQAGCRFVAGMTQGGRYAGETRMEGEGRAISIRFPLFLPSQSFDRAKAP
jgi:hypothetical protein